jgi:carbonic anhydrase
MTKYKKIFENNRKWAAEKKADNESFFENLGKGQDPDFLYIGCSDSRVSAEELMGVEPGEVFVHRNIANVVSNNDLNVMSIIDYAVKQLDVKHIVVCGHYGCGGVKAAMEQKDLGILNPWLRNIRDVYRLHKNEMALIREEEHKYKRLIELNVEEQMTNVLKTAAVQQSINKNGYPEVHGWVFDIHTGELIDLKIDFREKLNHIKEIYDLGH